MKQKPRYFDFGEFLVILKPVVAIAIILGAMILFPAISIVRNGHKTALDRAMAMQLADAFKYYRSEYGTVLDGNNARSITVLRGDNPRGISFFEAPAHSYNPEGELVDSWGNPFRIDLSDPTKPRVWSCGKNERDDGGAEGSDDIANWR